MQYRTKMFSESHTRDLFSVLNLTVAIYYLISRIDRNYKLIFLKISCSYLTKYERIDRLDKFGVL